MGYIYLRTNLINGKKYVGQAKDVKTRNGQWENLNRPYAGKAINAARAKYGIDAFGFEILKECDDKELNQWEMYYIEKLNTKVPYGYNMTDGGDSVYEITEETRKKLSILNKGEKNHFYGKRHTEETKKKISAALRGKPNPKHATALRGKKQSPETIEKRVAKLRGRKRPAEVVAKCAAANKGKKRSEETKAKLSAAHRGKKLSEEAKAKVAAAQSKPIQALDKITGEVVFTFSSAAEAGRQGFSSSHITECCNGKRKSHKGYIWRWKCV